MALLTLNLIVRVKKDSEQNEGQYDLYSHIVSVIYLVNPFGMGFC